MQKKLIVGNWKMHPVTLAEAKKIVTAISAKTEKFKKVSPVIVPPAIYLEHFGRQKSRIVDFGAQDAFWETEGAFTGEVSAAMLAKLGIKYVIIGHSERREMGETSQIANKKVKAVLKAGMTPILCVGERAREDDHSYHHYIEAELRASLVGIKKADLKKLVVAYEPVWAIGTKAAREATPAESLEMSIFIRKILSDMFGAEAAKKVRMLYGGSVNTKNAEAFLADGGVDGVLVGRESRIAQKFVQILYSAEHLS